MASRRNRTGLAGATSPFAAPFNGRDSTGRSLSPADIINLQKLHSDIREDIVRLEDLRSGIQESLREAHGVLKDLRTETQRAQRVLPMIVSKRIKEELTKQLAEMSEETRKAMAAAVAKVGREFDKLEAIFLGEDSQARKGGKPSIRELADLVELGRSIQDTDDAGGKGDAQGITLTQEVHGEVQPEEAP